MKCRLLASNKGKRLLIFARYTVCLQIEHNSDDQIYSTGRQLKIMSVSEYLFCKTISNQIIIVYIVGKNKWTSSTVISYGLV